MIQVIPSVRQGCQHHCGQRIVWGRKVYTAGANTKAGKHEPHLTPSLLSSTSPHKPVFWFLDYWQAALFAIQRVFNKSICLGIIINLHAPPPFVSTLPPFATYSSLSLSRAHLHVCGKGWRVADGGAGGPFRDPQSQWYISHMTN